MKNFLFLLLAFYLPTYAETWQSLQERIDKAVKTEFAEDLKAIEDEFDKELKDSENKEFLQKNAYQLVLESKILLRTLWINALESSLNMRSLYEKATQDIQNKTIVTFEQFVQIIQAPIEEEILKWENAIEKVLPQLKISTNKLQKILTLIKSYKVRFFSCLHSIEPITFDEEMIISLPINDVRDPLITPEKVKKLKELLNTPAVDTLFVSLAEIAQDPLFQDALMAKQRGEKFNYMTPEILSTGAQIFVLYMQIDKIMKR